MIIFPLCFVSPTSVSMVTCVELPTLACSEHHRIRFKCDILCMLQGIKCRLHKKVCVLIWYAKSILFCWLTGLSTGRPAFKLFAEMHWLFREKGLPARVYKEKWCFTMNAFNDFQQGSWFRIIWIIYAIMFFLFDGDSSCESPSLRLSKWKKKV